MNDNFSFSRLALVWRCYSPGMGKQLLLTGGLTLVAYLVSFMATQVVWGILLYGMMSYVTTITYCCGPLHFARFRDASFDLQIPATPGERTAVMLGYTLVVVPGVMAAVWFGASFVTSSFSPDAWISTRMMVSRYLSELDQSELASVSFIFKYTWLQQLQNILPALVCLLCVVLSRRNKVLKGVIGIIVTYIVMAVGSGVIAFVVVLWGVTADFSQNMLASTMTAVFAGVLYALAVVAAIMVVFTAWRLNRAFRHRQA